MLTSMSNFLVAVVILSMFSPWVAADPFSVRCITALDRNPNLLLDGDCTLSSGAWNMRYVDDWIAYPKKHINLTYGDLGFGFDYGSCCSPNPDKTFRPWQVVSGEKAFIADAPLSQMFEITSTLKKTWIDDGASYLELQVSFNAPPYTQLSEFYTDTGFVVEVTFLDYSKGFLLNYTSGARFVSVKDLTQSNDKIDPIIIPMGTRFVVRQFFNFNFISLYHNHLYLYRNLLQNVTVYATIGKCFDNINANIHLIKEATTLYKLSNQGEWILYYMSVVNTVVVPLTLFLAIKIFRWKISFPAPIHMNARQPSHKRTVLLSLYMSIVQFVMRDAWALVLRRNSQSPLAQLFSKPYRSIALFVTFLSYGGMFYPVFICYQLSHRSRFANAMGAYTLATLIGQVLATDLQEYFLLDPPLSTVIVVRLLTQTPVYLAFLVVLGYFLRQSLVKPTEHSEANFRMISNIEELYVRKLLWRRNFTVQREIPIGIGSKVWRFITLQGWPKDNNKRNATSWKQWVQFQFGIDPDIRIPFLLLAALVMLEFCLYQVVLYVILVFSNGNGSDFACAVSPWLSSLNGTLSEDKSAISSINLARNDDDSLAFANTLYSAFSYTMVAAGAGGGIVSMIYATGILRRFTKDIMLLRRGDYQLFKGKKDNTVVLDDAIRFMGNVIGFGFTGTFAVIMELMLIGSLITLVVLIHEIQVKVVNALLYGTALQASVISVLFQIVLKQVTQVVFVQSNSRFRVRPGLRDIFNHYSYFISFASFAGGFTSYLFRMIKMIGRFPLFSERVDRNIERWDVRMGDSGYVAYLGMVCISAGCFGTASRPSRLLAEHELNNPILVQFVKILTQIHDKKRNTSLPWEHKSLLSRKSYSVDCEITGSTENLDKDWTRVRARIRWHLLYTLIKNPAVRFLVW
ncbi:retinol binding protein receptor-domain-containing protein [Endogone sp. FLAS-F59071]|nr:retinol binding protein receptor-domain-containing protein [Endogone sp. FLAS-F59071]|eukprot:RUS22606.1 retinol binding protein receptor-domain-containing protein [Endogone sp. FLAS-F59071]